MSQASNRREQLRRQQEAAARAARQRRLIGVIAGLIALVLVGVLVFALVSNCWETDRLALLEVRNLFPSHMLVCRSL